MEVEILIELPTKLEAFIVDKPDKISSSLKSVILEPWHLKEEAAARLKVV